MTRTEWLWLFGVCVFAVAVVLLCIFVIFPRRNRETYADSFCSIMAETLTDLSYTLMTLKGPVADIQMFSELTAKFTLPSSKFVFNVPPNDNGVTFNSQTFSTKNPLSTWDNIVLTTRVIETMPVSNDDYFTIYPADTTINVDGQVINITNSVITNIRINGFDKLNFYVNAGSCTKGDSDTDILYTAQINANVPLSIRTDVSLKLSIGADQVENITSTLIIDATYNDPNGIIDFMITIIEGDNTIRINSLNYTASIESHTLQNVIVNFMDLRVEGTTILTKLIANKISDMIVSKGASLISSFITHIDVGSLINGQLSTINFQPTFDLHNTFCGYADQIANNVTSSLSHLSGDGDIIIDLGKGFGSTKISRDKDLAMDLSNASVSGVDVNTLGQPINHVILQGDWNHLYVPIILILNESLPSIIISKTGAPVCANAWAQFTGSQFKNIYISGLSTLDIKGDSSTQCSSSDLNVMLQEVITGSFIVNGILQLDIDYDFAIKVRSGYCSSYLFGCEKDINQNCPYDQITVLDSSMSGHVNVVLTITNLRISYSLQTSYDPDADELVINNISIKTHYDSVDDVLHIDTSISIHDLIVDPLKIGININLGDAMKEQIDFIVNNAVDKMVHKKFSDIVNKVVDSVNKKLSNTEKRISLKKMELDLSGSCAYSYNDNTTDTTHQCPINKPTCVNYVQNQKWGTCV